MLFTEDDQVVQALPAYRPDDPLGVRVLPRRPGSCDDLLDAQPCQPVTEPVAVDGVTVSEQIPGFGALSREGFDDLLGGPPRRGVSRDVEVNDAPV